MEIGKDGLAGFQKMKPEKELKMDPLSEKELFLRFVKDFWNFTETKKEDGEWSYYDKGVNLIVAVKPIESKFYKHEYQVRIIDRMND